MIKKLTLNEMYEKLVYWNWRLWEDPDKRKIYEREIENLEKQIQEATFPRKSCTCAGKDRREGGQE